MLGGLLGGGTGALIGAATGHAGAGAAIGAGVGALTGAAIGHSQDETEARNRALIAQQLGRQVSAGAVTPGDVIAMTRAGVNEELILNHIRSHGMAVPLQPQDLITLQQQGISAARDRHDASLSAAGAAAGSGRAAGAAASGRGGESLLGPAILSSPLLLLAVMNCWREWV